MQTKCEFKAHLRGSSAFLGCPLYGQPILSVCSPYTPWLGPIIIPSCLVISVASYIKIFRTLSRQQAQIQDHVQQQSSQPNALNMARCKKAMYSALWVQLALVVCYVPLSIVVLVITHTKTYSPLLMVIREIAITFAYLHSTLDPFLYCWKIHEVRRAVKQIIRQVMCCPWI